MTWIFCKKNWSKMLIPAWNRSSNILLPPICSHHCLLCSMTKLKEHSREICYIYIGMLSNQSKIVGRAFASSRENYYFCFCWCYNYLFSCYHYYHSTTLSSSVNITSPPSGNLLVHLSQHLQLLLVVIFLCPQQKWGNIFLCLLQGSLMGTGQW